jgi:hypothetical protein
MFSVTGNCCDATVISNQHVRARAVPTAVVVLAESQVYASLTRVQGGFPRLPARRLIFGSVKEMLIYRQREIKGRFAQPY